jgi:hypothetical protein
MLMTNHINAMVFSVHLGSGTILGCSAMCVKWFALMVSCMVYGALGVALPLFRFSPSFP